MKKILITVLILLFIFGVIRITTSTYENVKRKQKGQALPVIKIINAYREEGEIR